MPKPRTDLEIKRLKEVLFYNLCNGIFLWKKNSPRGPRGKSAGTIRKDGYIIIRIDGKNYLASRLAWLYVYGKWPELFIDHLDRNPSNNSIWNLRDVSARENMKNSNSYKDGLCLSRLRRKSYTHYLRRKTFSQLWRED